jgi:uncharacterized iron-regulated membrane protein
MDGIGMSSWLVALLVVGLIVAFTIIRMRMHRLRLSGRADAMARKRHATTAAFIVLGLVVIGCIVVASLL